MKQLRTSRFQSKYVPAAADADLQVHVMATPSGVGLQRHQLVTAPSSSEELSLSAECSALGW